MFPEEAITSPKSCVLINLTGEERGQERRGEEEWGGEGRGDLGRERRVEDLKDGVVSRGRIL